MKLADLSVERKLWKKGYQTIAGIDEVGRGSWAGPVVAGAVVLPRDWKLPPKLADSKLLQPKEREALAKIICAEAVCYSVAEVGLTIINREGIGKATQRAFRLALKKLAVTPDYHLIDAFYVKYVPKGKQRPIIKGDQKSASIAAASIIAKVHRDRLMRKLALQFPAYQWARNKGYGTKIHQTAIKKHGFSPLHRRSFNLSFLGVS
jgi:ribonuclease HII